MQNDGLSRNLYFARVYGRVYKLFTKIIFLERRRFKKKKGVKMQKTDLYASISGYPDEKDIV